MPVCYDDDGYPDDCGEDPEGPSEDDLAEDDDEETATVPCPHCGADVYEWAERCPRCGDWIVPGVAGGRRFGGLIYGVIVLLLIIALLYYLL